MARRAGMALAVMVALGTLAWMAGSAQPSGIGAPGEFLYVENTFGGDISVVAIPAHRVVGTIPASKVGDRPDDVAIPPSGDRLYVNRLDKRDVVALDTATEEVLWTLPLGGIPHHMAISDDGKRLYVPIYNENFLEVVDTDKRAVVARVPTGFGGHSTVLSDDGTRGYVGSILHDRISIFDTATNKVLKQIPFADGVRPFVVDRDKARLFVQLSNLHGLVVADVESGRIGQTIHLPPLEREVPIDYPHTVNHGLALTPDGRYLFAAASLADYVAVFAMPSLELIATVPVGKEPGWLAFSLDGRFCYASNRAENTVSVISVSERKELSRITVGNYPQRMTTARVPGRKVTS